jgi:hypothetical protein
MKTNNTSKKLLTALLSFTLLVATASAKSPTKYTNLHHYHHPLSVKYFGMKNDYLIFKVTVRANHLKKPELFIDESSMGSLYWKKIYSKTKVQWVRVRNNEDLNLHFELVAPNKSFYRTFTASNTVAKSGTISPANKDIAAN